MTPADALLHAHERRAALLYLECAHWHLMFHAAMDALTLAATAPERFEQVQRELRKERESFMCAAFAYECVQRTAGDDE